MEKFFHPIDQSIFSKRECRKYHLSSQNEGEKFIHLSTSVRGAAANSQPAPLVRRRRKNKIHPKQADGRRRMKNYLIQEGIILRFIINPRESIACLELNHHRTKQ
jgi:hypothetical protein